MFTVRIAYLDRFHSQRNHNHDEANPCSAAFSAFFPFLLTENVQSGEMPLINTADIPAEKNVEFHDATVKPFDGAYKIETHHREPWPGVTFKAPRGHWDLTNFSYVAVDLKNIGSQRVSLHCRVDNPGADGIKNCLNGSIELQPGEQRTLRVPLIRKTPADLAGKTVRHAGLAGRNER